MITLCGKEFSFSALNADDVDRLEAATEQMKKAFDKARREDAAHPLSYSDGLRKSCGILLDYINGVLGEGASQALDLNGSDAGKAMEVIDQLTEAVQNEKNHIGKALGTSQNRAQRRAEKRQKNKHKPPVSYPAQPAAARMVERVDKAARRKQLLAELAALE